jgi:hypothetical protein
MVANPRNQPSAYTEKVPRSIRFKRVFKKIPVPDSYVVTPIVRFLWDQSYFGHMSEQFGSSLRNIAI